MRISFDNAKLRTIFRSAKNRELLETLFRGKNEKSGFFMQNM